ncbi:MAG TPA: hypothetical protein VGM18_07025 [Candidatus Sulfotelmatobacter sp.]
MEPYKFGHLNASGVEAPFQYANCWAVEKTSGPPRLVIAPAAAQIRIISKLTAAMESPFGLLFVLLVPRGGGEAGRYQSPEPINSHQLEEFLWEFQDLLEKDARHHFWIMSIDNSSLLVYDNHNVIYAYGPLEAFERILTSDGFAKCDDVQFPVPHMHRYNAEFDEQQRQLLKHWDWIKFPLQDSDDR